MCEKSGTPKVASRLRSKNRLCGPSAALFERRAGTPGSADCEPRRQKHSESTALSARGRTFQRRDAVWTVWMISVTIRRSHVRGRVVPVPPAREKGGR